MANLTFEQQVLKQPTGLGAQDGYWLVIYESHDGGGASVVEVLQPGVPYEVRKNIFFLRKQPTYFAIAVVDAKQSLQFSEPVTMEDAQWHKFELLFDLTYRVSHHQKVAELREQDPLRRLRDEIALAINRSFKRQDWVQIKQHFPDLEQAILQNDLEVLKPYARELGLQIIGLRLSKRLPEEELTPEKTTAEAQLKWHKLDLEAEERRREAERASQLREQELNARLSILNKEAALHAAEQNRLLSEARTQAASKAMLNVGGSIETPAELLDAYRAVREIGEASPPSAQTANTSTGLAGYNTRQLAAGMPGGAEDTLAKLLGEVLREINQWGHNFAQKRALTSAVLHIVAEVLLNDHADEEKLAVYIRTLKDVGQSLQPQLNRLQRDLLELFLNPAQLRERFK